MTNTNVRPVSMGITPLERKARSPCRAASCRRTSVSASNASRRPAASAGAAMAKALGVDPKQLLRWRKGVEPCGGAMHSIFRFASRLPGGLEILIGEGFQMTFFKD